MIKTDICIIGAGSGGISAAISAAKYGARVVLIQNREMGGDHLNYGCIPSKSLIAAARVANLAKEGNNFGIKCDDFYVDMDGVYRHVHNVINQIAPQDSVARMESLGIKVIQGSAKFLNPHKVQVGSTDVTAKYFVIATGSRPKIPSISGLNETHYFTNETIFGVRANMQHLIIIGGGPIGIEMAQAYRRLGSSVTVLQNNRILPRDDSEMVEVVKSKLRTEGVNIFEQTKVLNIKKHEGTIVVDYEKYGKRDSIIGSHILVAAGRYPNVMDLHLEHAGVEFDQFGIKVDDRLRTNKSHIYAIGDVIGKQLFTHIAGYHADIAIRNIIFKWPVKIDSKAIPWVTYTDPELAHVGLNEAEAKKLCINYRILRFDFREIDRAQTELQTDGLIKVLVCPSGVVLGVSIVGHSAGELISPWCQAIAKGENISTFMGHMVPYPTYSEINKRVAENFYTPKIFSGCVKKIARLLLRLT